MIIHQARGTVADEVFKKGISWLFGKSSHRTDVSTFASRTNPGTDQSLEKSSQCIKTIILRTSQEA